MSNMQGAIYLKDTPEPVLCDSFTFGAKGLLPMSNGVKGNSIPLKSLKMVWGYPIPESCITAQSVYDYLKSKFC